MQSGWEQTKKNRGVTAAAPKPDELGEKWNDSSYKTLTFTPELVVKSCREDAHSLARQLGLTSSSGVAAEFKNQQTQDKTERDSGIRLIKISNVTSRVCASHWEDEMFRRSRWLCNTVDQTIDVTCRRPSCISPLALTLATVTWVIHSFA